MVPMPDGSSDTSDILCVEPVVGFLQQDRGKTTAAQLRRDIDLLNHTVLRGWREPVPDPTQKSDQLTFYKRGDVTILLNHLEVNVRVS